MSDSTIRTRTDPRISRRRRAVQRSRRRRLAVRTGVAAAVAGVLWLAFLSPILQVRHVKVVGARHTSVSAVEDAVLREGENLVLLSTSEVATRVAALPWVRRVEVDRKLPGTVRIRLTERRPAMVLTLGEARWTIDGEGRVLAAGEAADGLPVLAGLEVGDVEPGSRLGGHEATSALRIFRSLPPALKSEVEAVLAPTVERITLSLRDGVQVRYGAAEDMASKSAVLRVLLERLRTEGTTAAYIDVRVPGAPAVSSEVTGSPAAPGATPQPSATPTATP